MLSASAQAYIFFPGGFGTMDEFFEMITLVQTNKMEPVPIICVGTEYWSGLDSWIRSKMLNELKTINNADAKLYQIVDKAEEAMELVKQSKERKYF